MAAHSQDIIQCILTDMLIKEHYALRSSLIEENRDFTFHNWSSFQENKQGEHKRAHYPF